MRNHQKISLIPISFCQRSTNVVNLPHQHCVLRSKHHLTEQPSGGGAVSLSSSCLICSSKQRSVQWWSEGLLWLMAMSKSSNPRVLRRICYVDNHVEDALRSSVFTLLNV